MNKRNLILIAGLLATSLTGIANAAGHKASKDIESTQGELQQAREALHAAAEKIAHLYGEQSGPHVLRLMRGLHHGQRAMLGSASGEGDDEAPGVLVDSVTPGGPADEAGLQNGDLITAIDSVDLTKAGKHRASRKLVGYLNDKTPGDTVVIHYRRDGKPNQLSVVTEALGDDVFAYALGDPDVEAFQFNGPGRFHFNRRYSALDELELVKLSQGMGWYFDTDEGLLVVHVPDDSKLGLKSGDVILRIGERKPKNQRQAMRILNSYEPDESLKVEIIRHKKHKTLKITIPKSHSGSGAR